MSNGQAESDHRISTMFLITPNISLRSLKKSDFSVAVWCSLVNSSSCREYHAGAPDCRLAIKTS